MNDVFEEFTPEEYASMRKKHRREIRRRNRIITATLTLLLVTVLTAAMVVVGQQFYSGSSAVTDYTGQGTTDVVVRIPEGATGKDMGRILEEHGVVSSATAFVDAFKKDPRATAIQTGSYKLKKKMSAAAALSALLDPSNIAQLKITIPEGFTKWQVRDRMVNIMGFDAKDIDEAMKNAKAIGLPPQAAGNIEGWLAPATYDFDPNVKLEVVLSTMVKKRVAGLKSLGVPEDQWQSVLIKASIVDREAGTADFAKVARVIENRLGDNAPEVAGRLQMDSTVLYGVGKTGSVPSRDELNNDNSFNTYKIKGLPPTPIGAASEQAIKAVQHPADGNWLYFTTVNLQTGETKFTHDYAEQQKFQAEFRKWYAEHPDYAKK